MSRGRIRESMQVTTAMPAWATPSKPEWSKVRANSRLASRRSSKDRLSAATRANYPVPTSARRGVTPRGGPAEADQGHHAGDHGAAPGAEEDRVQLLDAGLLDESLVGRAPGVATAADLVGRGDVGLDGVVAPQPDRGQGRDPDQHPDHPGDHEQRAGDAVEAGVGAGQERRVDRGEREPEPEAGDGEHGGGREVVQRPEAPARHQPEADRREHHPDRRDRPGGGAPGQHAAEERADRAGRPGTPAGPARP